MILLDTTFLIDLLKKRKGAVNKAIELIGRDILSTTYINVYELLLGVYNIKNIDQENKLRQIETLLDNLEILNLDKESAIKAAKIGGDLMLKGEIIGDTENIISGIALTNSINTIVTRDKKHFERIKGIKVEEY